MSSSSLTTQYSTRAFLLTISTKDDLSREAQTSVLKWIQKGTEMHHVVIETGQSGKRHLHAVLIYKADRDARRIQDNLWARHVHPHHSDSIGKVAVKVQVCPGNDWYSTYLKKERDVEVLSSTYDPVKAEEYFPAPEIQELLMAKRAISASSSSKAWWDKHVRAWTESPYTDEPTGAFTYVMACFCDGTMNRIKRQRDIVDLARALYDHRHQRIVPNERERWMLQQLEDGPSYDPTRVVADPVPGGNNRITKHDYEKSI